jgi:hypothetical protein
MVPTAATSISSPEATRPTAPGIKPSSTKDCRRLVRSAIEDTLSSERSTGRRPRGPGLIAVRGTNGLTTDQDLVPACRQVQGVTCVARIIAVRGFGGPGRGPDRG